MYIYYSTYLLFYRFLFYIYIHIKVYIYIENIRKILQPSQGETEISVPEAFQWLHYAQEH